MVEGGSKVGDEIGKDNRQGSGWVRRFQPNLKPAGIRVSLPSEAVGIAFKPSVERFLEGVVVMLSAPELGANTLQWIVRH